MGFSSPAKQFSWENILNKWLLIDFEMSRNNCSVHWMIKLKAPRWAEKILKINLEFLNFIKLEALWSSSDQLASLIVCVRVQWTNTTQKNHMFFILHGENKFYKEIPYQHHYASYTYTRERWENHRAVELLHVLESFTTLPSSSQ